MLPKVYFTELPEDFVPTSKGLPCKTSGEQMDMPRICPASFGIHAAVAPVAGMGGTCSGVAMRV